MFETTLNLALLGSGEYTDAMIEVDRLLIGAVGGPAEARVALVPTASGLEPGAPERWNRMGLAHFEQLGVTASPLDLLTSADAEDRGILRVLERANLIYFSGGDPHYLKQTLKGSSAWRVIGARYRAGAVVAGSSAGAMMLGEQFIERASITDRQAPRWHAGAGLASGMAIFPHFDRFEARFRELAASAPAGLQVVGIDEDTALLSPAVGGGEAWLTAGVGRSRVLDTETSACDDDRAGASAHRLANPTSSLVREVLGVRDRGRP